ncbi:MAG: type II toxin-antitoxin system Phd/YefM family antitoxin [Chthoniobacterales bacterium]
MTKVAADFAAKCTALVDEVQEQGGELVISKDGCVVARLAVAGKDRPWLALRGKGRFTGDAFLPVVTEKEIEVLAWAAPLGNSH